MKAISKMLQSKLGPWYVRTWFILALCISNFVMATGIAYHYNRGTNTAVMIIGIIATLICVAILAVPNMEPDPDEEDKEN